MIIRYLVLLKKETAGQILYYFLEDSGYLLKLVSYKTEKEEKIALNISKFFNKLRTYEMAHEDASVFAVVDWLEMSAELGESPIIAQTDISSYDAVNILTVHSAKGLEFPVVFLVNLTQGRFPTYEKRETISIPQPLIKEILPEGDYHLEEERRLFYVGATRACDKVFLTASLFYNEGKKERKISQFVTEALGEEFVKKQPLIKKEEKAQLSIFDFRPQQEIIIKEKINLHQFSFSQIEIFKTCPLQYKYQYLLKIPTTPSAAGSFGTTIHQCLQKFYQEFLTNKNIDEKRLLEIYQISWIPVGYVASTHQTRMKKEGERMLVYFFKKFHSPKLKIIALEKLFKIKIDNNIFITGKIDRVDEKDNQGLEIIDYKTGKIPGEKELKKSIQLSIYALAAADKGLFNKKLEEISLTFYYLQKGKRITMKRSYEEIADVKEGIKKTVSEIQKNEFLPNAGRWCDFCPFKIICEAWQ